ncbi:dTMP kinase [Candidatus Margulisiibacteriota bacterium]
MLNSVLIMIGKKYRFITFEGIEGVGKSTQILKLFNYLNQKEIPVIQSKEPGGTEFGLGLRKILLDPQMKFSSPYTEVLLFYADRLEHIQSKIKPALSSGKIVLCDRYLDSTFAYQIGGRNMPKSLIADLNKLVDLKPDLTVLFDMDLSQSLARAEKRSALDRFEQENLDFHQRVRDAYLFLAEKEPHRVKVIKVDNLDEDRVFGKLLSLLGN